MVDLARIESGRLELHPETFPVQTAIEETAARIQVVAQHHHLGIDIEVGAGLETVTVTLDPHKFKQILFNLLSYMIHFADDGGRVAITARPLDQQQLQIEIRAPGCRIKPEDRSRIFTEFEQRDAGTTNRHDGIGLSLALTKKLVEFQGGQLDVRSEAGQGSAFTVVLPLAAEERPTTASIHDHDLEGSAML